jgi:hypothetical protein
MRDPKRANTPEVETPLGTSKEEDWWNGWRLDEPEGSLLAPLEAGSDDWWAGWHAALLREG